MNIMFGKSGKILAVILCAALCFTCAVSISTQPVYASAGSGAVKYLKGTWDSVGRGGTGAAMFYVKFTRNNCKYYVRQSGRLKLNKTAKIVSAKKLSKGYLVKIKDDSGTKYSYRTKTKNELSYYASWSKTGYSEEESLTR